MADTIPITCPEAFTKGPPELPELMAASVATPLEKQFSTISGVDSMTSSSSLGMTNVTLKAAYGNTNGTLYTTLATNAMRGRQIFQVTQAPLDQIEQVRHGGIDGFRPMVVADGLRMPGGQFPMRGNVRAGLSMVAPNQEVLRIDRRTSMVHQPAHPGGIE